MTYTPPVDAADEYLAGLPWDQAQLALGRGAPISTSRRTAVCGWHGPSVDAETGAFAIVRSDGPLAGLVGERLQITYRAGTRERTIAVRREHERRGTGRRRGTIVRTNPLLVDLHGSELQLDASDVTLGRSVLAGPALAVGDVLVLVEVDTAEWVAVDVEGS
jgi:hypothetical protein